MPSLETAQQLGDLGMRRAQIAAEHERPNFTRDCAAYMASVIVTRGPKSGELLTDLANLAGYVPSRGNRAMGAVFKHLLRHHPIDVVAGQPLQRRDRTRTDHFELRERRLVEQRRRLEDAVGARGRAVRVSVGPAVARLDEVKRVNSYTTLRSAPGVPSRPDTCMFTSLDWFRPWEVSLLSETVSGLVCVSRVKLITGDSALTLPATSICRRMTA